MTMLKAMRELESTIWGNWENVPFRERQRIEQMENSVKTVTKISRLEYERAKAIVNEYEFADIAQEEHKGHFQCTTVDCIL